MAIIETVTETSFIDAFRRMDRMDGWTYDGLRALYAYLDDLSDDLGEPIELDVIALCCDYCEHASALEAAKEYGYEPDEGADEEGDEDDEELALAWLRDQTTVIEFDGGVIVQPF